MVYSGGPSKKLPARAKITRGGSPSDYLPWVAGIANARGASPSTSADMDYLSKVPYRSVGR